MKTACSKRNHGLANIWNKFLSYITTGNLLFAFFLFMSQDNQPTIDGLMDLSGGACGDRGIRVRKGGGKPIPLPHTSIYNIFWSNWQNGTTHPVEKHGATERLSHFRSFKLELCIAYTYNLDEFCFALVLPHFICVHGFHQIWPPHWSTMKFHQIQAADRLDTALGPPIRRLRLKQKRSDKRMVKVKGNGCLLNRKKLS